jgi:hypothetical protein
MAEKEEDRQRLRDVKADEAFNNLKSEMGFYECKHRPS